MAQSFVTSQFMGDSVEIVTQGVPRCAWPSQARPSGQQGVNADRHAPQYAADAERSAVLRAKPTLSVDAARKMWR